MLHGTGEFALIDRQLKWISAPSSWYRKHFHLNSEWESDGGATFVHFEGVFHHATFFLNVRVSLVIGGIPTQ
jgi:hypothetical protein